MPTKVTIEQKLKRTEKTLATAIKRLEKLERMVAEQPQLWKPWPRVSYPGGFEMWKNAKGQFHRTDGPAREIYCGDSEYYIDGKKLTKAQFYKHPKCQIKRPKGKKRNPRKFLKY